jgi:hypothetical protein
MVLVDDVELRREPINVKIVICGVGERDILLARDFSLLLREYADIAY